MKIRASQWFSLASGLLTGAGIACVLLTLACLTACGVGRSETGQVIWGLDMGRIAETAPQALKAAASFLPPPFDLIATGAVTLLLGGGGVGVAAKKIKAAEDKGWGDKEKEALINEQARLLALYTPAPGPVPPPPVVPAAPV